MSTNRKILVATDTEAYAALVKRLLDEEFDNVSVSTNPGCAKAEFERIRPDVLLLAFDSLEKSEAYYYSLPSLRERGFPLWTLIFCNRSELERVYELCKNRRFDDYILFSSTNRDTFRLRMAVHHAFRQVADNNFGIRITDGCEDTKRALDGGAGVVHDSPGVAESRLAPESAPPRPEQALTARIHATVLVVDDDEFHHKLISRMLRELDIEVISATSGSDALIALCKHSVDLVLMDQDMPDIKGVDVTRRVKQSHRWADIPVIMITGHSEMNVVVDSRKAGATDFLVKPFDKESLIAKLNGVLREEIER